MSPSTHLILCCSCVLVLFLNPRSSVAQEVEDESEFSYVNGSLRGPENWGEIKPEWRACKTGSMQSPIDLLDERVEIVSDLGRLKRNYKPADAVLKNRGHDIMLQWKTGAGFVVINGTKFILQQVHWHSPSEHTLNGKRFALEAHMVHESIDNQTMVVGIMYTYGRQDPFLFQLKGSIKSLVDNHHSNTTVGVKNPKDIKIGSRKYYRYRGSLTVPPCTERVVWTITRKVRTVSRDQVRLLREAVHDSAEMNARPLQETNNRPIYLYRPDVHINDNKL